MARQHGVDPRREKQDVRSGHDENSAWFENTGEFCQYGHLVVDMLDAFRVKDTTRRSGLRMEEGRSCHMECR